MLAPSVEAPHCGQLESWLSTGTETGPAIVGSLVYTKKGYSYLIFGIVQESEEVDGVKLKATIFER